MKKILTFLLIAIITISVGATYIPSVSEAELGSAIKGRTITATLHVSPDGSNANGLTWETAYTTIQGALDAASTDANDCTLILIAPHPTFYNIDTTGDPTWTGNYELKGTHRLWAPVKNTHNNATSIMKFTGSASIEDLAFVSVDNGIGGSTGGVIFTKKGYRLRHCGFNSEAATHAMKAIHIDGSAGLINGGKIEDVEIRGTKTVTTGLYMNTARINSAKNMNFHACLTAVQVIGATSVSNYFEDFEIGDCTLGLDIDAGSEQHFRHINYHDVTTRVDDEVKDHHWSDIHGEFEIYITPADLSGVSVTAGDGVYGADTELIAAGAIDVPFKVVSYQLSPSNEETTLIRFSADSGSTYFAESVFSSAKNKAAGAGDATDFIFNAGTRISVSVHSPAAARSVDVWLEIQEL